MAKIMTLADEKKILVFTSAITISTVHFILLKHESPVILLNKLKKFSIICRTATVHHDIILKGYNSNFKDLEDAFQYFSSLGTNCDTIISRNHKDFKLSRIPVMTAEEFLFSYE